MLAIALLLITTAVYIQATTPIGSPPCCWSTKGKSKFWMIGGKVDPNSGDLDFIEYSGEMYRDDDRKKKIQFRSVPQKDGSFKKEIEYADYNSMKWYVVSDGVCTTHDIKHPMPDPCVPPNATYAGESLIGDDPQIRVNHYKLDWLDFRGYNIRLSVLPDTCHILMETDYGNVDGAQATYTYFLSDRRPLGSDSSIIALPAECRHFDNGMVG